LLKPTTYELLFLVELGASITNTNTTYGHFSIQKRREISIRV